MGIDVGLVFKVASMGVTITILYTFLKQAGRDEYAFMTLLIGVAVTLLWITPAIANFFSIVESVFKLN